MTQSTIISIIMISSMVLMSVPMTFAFDCSYSNGLDTDNWFLDIVNSCLIDTTKINIMASFASQFLEWFTVSVYSQYIVAMLMFLPFISFCGNIEPGNTARANHIRFQCVMLLFRLGTALSVSTWLQTAFQQERPCICNCNQCVVFSLWGMPSVEVVVAVVAGAHFIQYIQPLAGILLIAGACYSVLTVGAASVGQVLAGLLIGLIIHLYQVFTPLFMRPIDFLVNLAGGLLTIILVHNSDDSHDFSFVVNFLDGAAWMLFAMVIFFIFFGQGLLRLVYNHSTNFLSDETFLYYTPINKPDIDASSFNPQRPAETILFIISTVLLYVGLAGLKVYKPYINDTLNKL